MRLALMLGQRQQRRVPAVGMKARGFVDWKAEIIADLRSRDPLRLILVEARSPLAGEIVTAGQLLCEGGDDGQRDRHQQRYACRRGPIGAVHSGRPPAEAAFY